MGMNAAVFSASRGEDMTMSIHFKRRKQKLSAPRAFDEVDPPVSPQNKNTSKTERRDSGKGRTTLNEFTGNGRTEFAGRQIQQMPPV